MQNLDLAIKLYRQFLVFVAWPRKVFAVSMNCPTPNLCRLTASIYAGKIVPMKSRSLTAAGRLLLLFSLAFFQVAPVRAQAMPTADELERTLSGSWVGALEYRDYQSGKKIELPMTARIEVGADGATVTRVSAFDDGPKTGMVYITTVSLFDVKANRTTYAVFRKGRAVETVADDVVVRDFKDPQNWTIVYTRKGTDGGSPAEIRVVQSRAGSELTELKEVKPLSAPDSSYAFRNQIQLRRK